MHQNNHNPCRHPCDWTDEDADITDPDEGCCSPAPVRRDCRAPVLPTPDCDAQDPVVTYDDDTEEFTVTTTMYDHECSALLDSDSSPLLSLIA